MKILVVDVAAEHGGALTILNVFREKCEADLANQYVFVLSTPHFEDTENTRYLNYRWIKKSFIHRSLFDAFFIKRIIRREKPDKLLSLQNKAVAVSGIPQDVYFHNVLLISDYKFGFGQSKKLWVYQHIIAPIVKRSLKKADRIIVQAEWIKEQLHNKWGIDRALIEVQRPEISIVKTTAKSGENNSCELFYPAGGEIYKNHSVLLKACSAIWNERGADCGLKLILTCEKSSLSSECRALTEQGDYPISFVGRLSEAQMAEKYQSTILVFPSVLETMGLPLLEAEKYGATVIAADLEYAHEALGDYSDAVYFNPSDYNELKSIIEKFLDKLSG